MAPAPSKWTIVGVLGGVAASSWMAALAVSRVTAEMLTLPDEASITDIAVMSEDEDSEPDLASNDTPPRASQKRAASSYIDPIVKRSLFDSSLVDQVVEASGPVAEGDGVASDLKVVLLATLVADPAEFSSALIAEEKGGDGALGYGIGDDLLGEGEIVRIEPRKVYVKRSNGSIEYISMEQGQEYERGPKKAKKKDGKKKEAADDEGITKDGPNKFIVDQELIDKVMENPEQLYSQVRATPHKGSGGGIEGYRLSGIRRRSLFYKLGIKNGDIVHSVNGQSMSSAMGAYNSLQSDKNFSFEVTRRSKRQTFEYEVR
jgi:type II secretion system protein C